MCPGIDYERPVKYQCIKLGTISLAMLLSDVLAYRIACSRICDGHKIRRRRLKSDLQSLIVNCLHSKLIYSKLAVDYLLSVLDISRCKEGVRRTCLRIKRPCNTICIIRSRYILTVRPLVVTELECPDSSVFIRLPTLCTCAFTLLFPILLYQTRQRL